MQIESLQVEVVAIIQSIFERNEFAKVHPETASLDDSTDGPAYR